MNTKKLKWVVLSFGLMGGLGAGLPGCPNQDVLQQQVSTLQTSNTELTKKVQGLTTQVSTLNNEVNQIKQLLPQITNVIQAQKAALDQLAASMQKGGKAPKGKPAKGKKK